ncbi:hypothetical protein [Spirosoma koreense]
MSLLLYRCGKPEATPAQVTFNENVSFNGWGSGGPYYTSTRNHHYKLTIDGSNNEVVIQLASSTLDLTYFIYSEAQYHSENALPDINYTIDGQKQQQIVLKNQPVGNYFLVVGTSQIGDLGDYSLTIDGINIRPSKISFEFLESSHQIWSDEGSGGSAMGNYKSVEFLSELNPRYIFTVNQTDSWVDIELIGEKGDVNGALYDQQGKQLYTYGERHAVPAVHSIHHLRAGTYTLLVGSYYKSNLGTFTLRLSGHTSNLNRKATPLSSFNDRWTQDGSFDYFQTKSTGKSHLYQVDLEADSTILDIVLTSGQDVSTNLFLVDQNRKYLSDDQAASKASIIASLGKGRYYVLVTTTTGLGGLSEIPYRLSIYGYVKEIKSL